MANVSSSNGLEKRPKLRFPGFDEPWRAAQLGNLLIELSDYATQESGFPLLTSSRQGLFVQEDYFIDKQANAETTVFSVLPYGCITYRHMSDDNIFHFNINRLVANGLVSKEYPVFTVRKEVLDTDFLVDTLNSSPLFSVFCIQQKKGGTRTRLYFKTLCSYQMFLPVLHEQQVIASFIRLLGKRIERQMELVETLKKYKRGVNKQLLSQIDNSCNCRLGSVCEIVGGGTPDTLHTEYWGSTVEWFTPSEIGRTKYVSSSVRKLSDIGLNNSSAKLLPIGTVLLTTRATLGEMSIAKRECCTNQGFQSLIPHQDRALSEYLYYMQIIIKPWCEKYASGNTFREISKSALSNCIIPLPDRARQEEIVKLLSSIDTLISAEEGIAMSLSKMRHSLMQQLFI